MKLPKEHIGYVVRGMLMGTADVIPGVSGGTIAFITGIYEKLIQSLNEIDLKAAKLLFTFKFGQLMRKINGSFLLSLVLGVFIAVLSLAKLLQFLLKEYPEAVWAFFFGLIIASVFVIARHIKKWRIPYFVALAIGAGLAYWLTDSSVMSSPNTLPFVFLAGVISIIAMILPGISGSFILVILDKYQYIIDCVSTLSTGLKDIMAGAVKGDWQAVGHAYDQMRILPLLVFWLGTLTGIIGFSRVLNWLFKRYHDLTIALLTGFLIGSLNKIWPWKEVLESKMVHNKLKVLREANKMPESYDGYFFMAVLLAIVGFLFVYGLEMYTAKRKPGQDAILADATDPSSGDESNAKL